MNKKHLVIIPFYNEEFYLENCLNSIVLQTVRPTKLILVDDNSSDSSSGIAKSFTEKFDWIEYCRHASEKRKEQGVKVIKAFNFGLEQVDYSDFDFVSKLDADLEFPLDYFEKVLETFVNSGIGLAGGRIKELKNGFWVTIPQAPYHIRGALKTYRVSCFKEIGGFMPVLGWDGLDEMKAFYYKWSSSIVDSEVKHHRVADSDHNKLRLSFKRGVAKYQNGSGFLMVFFRSLKDILKKPFFLVGFSFLSGYIYALVSRKPKNVSKELALFIKKFQLSRLKPQK